MGRWDSWLGREQVAVLKKGRCRDAPVRVHGRAAASIASERYCHPNPRVQRRMEMLWLKCNGETHERIAELAGVDRRTVQRLLDLFEVGGLEAVRNFGEKGRANGWLAPRAGGSCVPRRAAAYGCRGMRPDRTVDGGTSGPHAGAVVLRDNLGLHWRKVAAVPVPPKQSLKEHARTQAAFLKGEA